MVALKLAAKFSVVKKQIGDLDRIVDDAIAEFNKNAIISLTVEIKTNDCELPVRSQAQFRVPQKHIEDGVKVATDQILENAYQRDNDKYTKACEAQKKMEDYMRKKYPKKFVAPSRDASPVRKETSADVDLSVELKKFYLDSTSDWQNKLAVYEKAWTTHPFFTKAFSAMLSIWTNGPPETYNQNSLMEWISRQHETHFWHKIVECALPDEGTCDACRQTLDLTHKLHPDKDGESTAAYCFNCGPKFNLLYGFLSLVHGMIKDKRTSPNEPISPARSVRLENALTWMTRILEN